MRNYYVADGIGDFKWSLFQHVRRLERLDTFYEAKHTT